VIASALLLLRSNSPGGLYLWCSIGFCAGIYLFIQGFRLLQRRRLILDTPLSRIRSASLGMVELNGLAIGPYTIVAPITARACYYYRTLVWEWKKSGKSKQWVKVAAESMHVPFFLDDNTGRLMIDPRGADLDLHRDFLEQFCDSFFTTKEEAPPAVHAFLSRHGVSTSNKIKVEEFCIKPTNALFILGTLAENRGLEINQTPILDDEYNTFSLRQRFDLSLDFDRMFLPFVSAGGDAAVEQRLATKLAPAGIARCSPAPSHPAEVIRLSNDHAPAKAAGMTQQQKVAAALVKAGISNPAAWAAAGVTSSDAAAAAMAPANQTSGSSQPAEFDGTQRQTAASPDGFDPHPAVVLMKGTNNSTFVISWRSQREVAASLAWKCALMIWGGPALVLLSLYVFLNLMHWL